MGRTKDIRDIALHFEMDGQLAAGYWGTNPFSLKRYFKNLGYNVKSVEGEDIINKPIPKADTYILSFWNSDDVKDMLHTVSIRPTKDGKIEVFNDDYKYKKSKTEDSIEQYISKEGVYPLSLQCISK